MPDVLFHFNVSDRQAYACRLLRKAVAGQRRVAVTGPAGLLGEIDAALWALSDIDFVAHCNADADEAVRACSPVVFCDRPEAAPHRDMVLNLGESIPPGFDGFAQVVELVESAEAQRAASRQRWKRYREGGCAVKGFDVLTRQYH